MPARRGGRRKIATLQETPPAARYLVIDNTYGVDHVMNGELYNQEEVEQALADAIDEDYEPDDLEVYQVGPRVAWYRETKVQVQSNKDEVLPRKKKGRAKK